MSKYADLITSKQREHGDKFDDCDLAPGFVEHFNTGARIEVDFGHEVKRGRVGVTTGWRPCFLLMLRRTSRGSSYTLKASNKVLRVVAP